MKKQFEAILNTVKLLSIPEKEIKGITESHIYHAMQKAYDLGKQESQWISVDDRLPEDKVATRYLVIRIDGSINMDIWTPFHGRRFDFMYRVTHWMPLPKQP